MLKIAAAMVLILVSISSLPEPAECQNNQVRIGALADQGKQNCLDRWGPTATYLSTKIPESDFIIVPLNSGELNAAVKNGSVDFIITNPFFYVNLESSYHARALLTISSIINGESSSVYGGVIFCRSDRDDIIEIDNLKDKTFMGLSGSPKSSWAIIIKLLKTHDIDPYKDFKDTSFSDSEEEIVFSVNSGRVDAGSVLTGTLERMEAEGLIHTGELKIIHNKNGNNIYPTPYSTKLYPGWPLAKAAYTANALAEKVTLALLDIEPEDPAAVAGKYAGWEMSLSYQPIHECLRELRFEPYDNLLNITLTDIIKHYWHWSVAVLCVLISSIIAIFFLTRFNKKLLLYRDRLRSLSSEISMTAEKERRQIAVELHEQICQVLAFSKINIEKVLKLTDTGSRKESLVETCGLIDEAIDATKSIVFTLSPPILYDLGFEAALEWLSRTMKEKHSINIMFENHGVPVPIEKDMSIFLFHAVRELIINAIKHSSASAISVSLSTIGSSLHVAVEDDGTGFKPGAFTGNTRGNNGFGLFNIQERIIFLGGKFKIESGSETGTKVLIVLPSVEQLE